MKKLRRSSIFFILSHLFLIGLAGCGSGTEAGGPDRWIVPRSADASHNSHKAWAAIDQDQRTRWTSNIPMNPGMYFRIDLGRLYQVDAIEMNLDSSPDDYPGGIIVAGSKSGEEWEVIREIKESERSDSPVVTFEPVTIRYLMMTPTGSHPDFFWSIDEFRVKSAQEIRRFDWMFLCLIGFLLLCGAIVAVNRIYPAGMGPVLKEAGILLVFSGIAYLQLKNLIDQIAWWHTRNDYMQQVWNFWWVRFSLFDLHSNPFFSTHLYYPEGVPLIFHTMTPMYGLLTAPVQLFFPGLQGLVLSVNLVIAGCFIFAGYGMYLFLKSLELDGMSAVMGAVLFETSRFARSHVFQLNLLTICWLPICLACLYRLVTVKTHSRKWIVLTSLALAAGFYSSLHNTYLVFLFSAIFLVFLHTTQWKQMGQQLKTNLVRGVTVLMLLTILVAPYLVQYMHHFDEFKPPAQSHLARLSADLSNLILPGINDYLIIDRFEQWIPGLRAGANHAFLGYSVLLILVLSLPVCLKDRRAGGFLLIGLFFTWLSLGPEIMFRGQSTAFPSLYGWMYDSFPFFDNIRTPRRFFLLAEFCFYTVIALWFHRMFMERAKWIRITAFLLMCSVFLIDRYNFVWKVPHPLTVHPFFSTLKHDKQEYSVLEIPQIRGDYRNMINQTIHEKPLLNGKLARYTNQQESKLRRVDVFNREEVESLNIKYLIVYRDDLKEAVDGPTIDNLLTTLENKYKRIVFDDQLIVFDTGISLKSSSPTFSPVFVAMGGRRSDIRGFRGVSE